ncbi:MAG: RsmE family RNA methyltransferase [Candidatus Taylorbacteria bacterium]
MRLHRFYVTEQVGIKDTLVIESTTLVHQIKDVFRLKSGDSVIVFDGSGSDFECTISDMNKKSISLNVVSTEKSHFMPTREVVLYSAIVKKDTFEWIVEKATELGVTTIIPVIANRSEKKALNMERLNKIAVEASEQSGRGDVPKIGEIMTLKDVIKSRQGLPLAEMIAFDIDAPLLPRVGLGRNVSCGLFIGPEGGWSSDEVALFHTNNIPVKSLGSQVLRAETAVIVALSLVMLGK